MIGYKSIWFAATCCLALTAPVALGDTPCQPDRTRAPIKVKIDDAGKPEVTHDAVKACEGEEIRWIFQGTQAREFAIIFRSAVDSPFDWSEQRGATVTGTIKAGAAKNRATTEYKYDVAVGDQRLDPRIIVDP